MEFNPVEIAKMSEAGLAEFIYEQDKQIHLLRRELKQARNELWLKCGNYREEHNGACNGCRYQRGGEWEKIWRGEDETGKSV